LYIESIWAAAERLPTEDLSVDDVRELDRVCWFSEVWGKPPTCRAVIEHCKRMIAAALSYPVILSPKGEVLDGVHRVAKAMLAGGTKVRAVRLTQMPAPDEQIPPDDPRYEAAPADER
jgi:hypothetical protein